MNRLLLFTALTAICGLHEAAAQWAVSGNNIHNTNSGNVGIGGDNSPSTLLYVAKNITEPTITVRNLGGFGGATYSMTDDASGASWKFKATLNGGFKIRDHANLIDVITIEPNSFANAIFIKSTDNIGVGTSLPAPSAVMDLTSTNKGFLVPRMVLSEITAIVNPADGLMVFCVENGILYIFNAYNQSWREVLYGAGTLTPVFTCGASLGVNHVAGAVAPVTKSVTYGTVTNIPGETSKCWITSNLGADHQATAVDDATEASAGWYWQFNKMQGYKHDGTTRTPNSAWISSISENTNWQTANDPCTIELGIGWRLPTSTEYYNNDNTGGWTNSNDTWNSALKMHPAGYLNYFDGSLSNRGTFGRYWSSSQLGSIYGYAQHFNSNDCNTGSGFKADGSSVRCCKDL